MIATERFVCLHLHKTGGTFLNECLLRFFPGARQLGYHLPRRLIPAELRALPVLGFVRNPWSYYVSWYSFQRGRPQRNALFDVASDHGQLDFKSTIRNLLELGSGSLRLDLLLAQLPLSYGNKGLNLPRFALEPIRETGMGFFSYLHHYMFFQAAVPGGPLFVGRNENLREDFLRFLAGVGVAPGPEMLAYVRTESARNPSEHGAYTDFYDVELRDLVAVHDRELIERYGYRFGD